MPKLTAFFLGLLIRLPAGAVELDISHFRSQCCRGHRCRGSGSESVNVTLAPHADDHQDDTKSQRESNARNVPCDAVKSRGGRRAQHFLAVFLDEILNDQIVGFARSDVLIEFLEHGSGRWAINVIALRKNLAATAHAHQLLAQNLGAFGFLRAHMQGEHRGSYSNDDGENQRESAMFIHFCRAGAIWRLRRAPAAVPRCRTLESFPRLET